MRFNNLSPSIIVVRSTQIFIVVESYLGYIAESSIQQTAKAKAAAARVIARQLIDSFTRDTISPEFDTVMDERIQLLDMLVLEIADTKSAMTPNSVKYAQGSKEHDYNALRATIQGLEQVSKENGFPFEGNNPYFLASKKLHLTIAKAGESQVMWQQQGIIALEQLVVDVQAAVKTAAYANTSCTLFYAEFTSVIPVATVAAADEAKNSSNTPWAAPTREQTTVKTATARRELATANAQG